MSKECKGKYHGSGVKYIDDDQKYCLVCQQEYERRKKRTKEVIVSIGTIGVAIIGGVIKFIASVGGKDTENNSDNNVENG